MGCDATWKMRALRGLDSRARIDQWIGVARRPVGVPNLVIERLHGVIDEALKESVEKRRSRIGYSDDLVRRLAIEFEIELGFGTTVFPVGKALELAPPQRALRERGAIDGDAHAGRLPGDAAFLLDRFRGRDDAARDEAVPALVLACENEHRVAHRDVLAAVHRFLRAKRKRLRLRITNLGLDHEIGRASCRERV